MNASEKESQAFDFHRIIHLLLRHKWKIIPFAVLGIVVALVVRFAFPPTPKYISHASLIVRYVNDQAVEIPLMGAENQVRTGGVLEQAIEIANSRDLAQDVAQAVGPETILDKGDVEKSAVEALIARIWEKIQQIAQPSDDGEDEDQDSEEGIDLLRAVTAVQEGLNIVRRGASTIHITFEHTNRELPDEVLEEFIRQFITRQNQVYRQSPEVRTALMEEKQKRETQENALLDELNEKRQGGGDAAVNEFTFQSFVREYVSTESTLSAYEAQLNLLESSSDEESDESTGGASSQPTAEEFDQDLRAYMELSDRLTNTRAQRIVALTRFDAKSQRIRDTFDKPIQEMEVEMNRLESKHPTLPSYLTPGRSNSNERGMGARTPLSAEQLRANIDFLRNKKNGLDEKLKKYYEVSDEIADIQRELENVRDQIDQFESAIQEFDLQAKVPEAQSDIKINQTASPAAPMPSEATKTSLIIIAAGFAIGLLLAAFVEFALSPTFSRAEDLRRAVRKTFVLAIPILKPYSKTIKTKSLKRRKSGAQQPAAVGTEETTANDTPGIQDAEAYSAQGTPDMMLLRIRPYCLSLRDHLVFHLASKKANEPEPKSGKPAKVIGVAGFEEGAGAMTVANGLYCALQEVGRGRIEFYELKDNGFGSHKLENLDKPKKGAEHETKSDSKDFDSSIKYASNVEETREETSLALFDPNRLLTPDWLKGISENTDQGYIVVKMPCIHAASPAVQTSRFLDLVVVVTQAERTRRSTVTQGNGLLEEAGADTLYVLNKERDHSLRILGKTIG